MKEYKVVGVTLVATQTIEDMLNAMALQGWHIVSVSNGLLYLERDATKDA